MNKLFNDFRLGKSPMLGIWILIIFGILALFLFPYLFTRNWNLPSFNNTGEIGDTFNGIAGPFIALAVAVLTFLAFWVQYQANQEQKKQFERQNQDQIFFKLLDTQESRVINSSFFMDDKEIKSFQLLERIVSEFKEKIDEKCHLFARQLIHKKPELIEDLYLREMFLSQMVLNSEADIFILDHFDEMKEKFLKDMNERDQNERWEYLKIYFGSVGNEGSQQTELLGKIGRANFYRVSFQERQDIYRDSFDQIERKYGSFLDGYLKGWEFISLFTNQSLGKEMYINFLTSQLSKFEMIILFYYIASGYSKDDLRDFIKQHKLLESLYYYNDYLIDLPSKMRIDLELESIFSL